MTNNVILVDGENLVMRFQEIQKSGYSPLDAVKHKKDAYVWAPLPNTEVLIRGDILRIEYYTTMVGADDEIKKTNDEISKIGWVQKTSSGNMNFGTLIPRIFKKGKKSHKNKSVDINICVNALRYAYSKSVDRITIMSGDGDYLPLIREIQNMGLSVGIAAFRVGLNPELHHVTDSSLMLDGVYFGRDIPSL